MEQNRWSDEATALAGIAAPEQFWQSLGLATTLGGLNIPVDQLEEIAGN